MAASQDPGHALRGNSGGSKSDLHISLDGTEPFVNNSMARFIAAAGIEPGTIAIYPQLPRVAASNNYAFSADEEDCLWLLASLRLRLPFSLMTPPDISYMPSGHLTVAITQMGNDRAVRSVTKVVVWKGWSLGRALALGLPRQTPYLI